jgi:hypothetical protein
MSSTRWSPAWRARILAGDFPEWLQRHPRRKRLIAVAIATPPWVDRGALADLRDRAKARSVATGVRHVVDHIVPVSHPYVCGLTVPWNLQIVPEQVNLSKGNAWHPDQLGLSLLPRIEQIALFQE